MLQMQILMNSLQCKTMKGSLAYCVLIVGCQTANVMDARLEAWEAISSMPTLAGDKGKQGNSQNMTL